MKRIADTVRRGWRALTRHQDWNIGIVDAPISAFVDPQFIPKIRWLPNPPAGCFAADPFVFDLNGTKHILYESYEFARERGILAALRLAPNGDVVDCGPVLSAATHLAYPYLFEWSGELYCVPESAVAGEIAIYRVERVPGDLKRVATLLAGVNAVDPSVFEHNGKWWLAFTDQATGPNEALYLYHADTPLGPWAPHALNPVKRDAGSSRPAGTPFMHQGSLYRPAQDCNSTYGGRIALNRVTELTPQRFSEETVRWIEPATDGPRPHGLHTISGSGSITVIDGKRERFVSAAAGAMLRRNLLKTVAKRSQRPAQPHDRVEPARPATIA